MPPKRASTIKTAAKEEAAKEQQKRVVERMKALTKGRVNVAAKSEDAMDIDEEEEEGMTPRPTTARAGARPRTATSTASTSSRRSINNSSSGAGRGSKSSIKPSTSVKRKSTSPVERLTKKQAIEEAAKTLRVRSSNYSPSTTTYSSSATKPQRTRTTSRPSTTFRGRGIPSRRQAPARSVETSDEEPETEEDEEEDEMVVPPAHQYMRRLGQVSAPVPIRAAPAAPVPVLSATSGGQSRPSYDKKGEKVGELPSIGVLGRLGHGLFKLLTYAIIILSTAFALHMGVEAYKHYTPLCFSDSFSNGQVITGRPVDAETCKTTWCCPPLCHCHGGRIAGVVVLEKVANTFGCTTTTTTSSPVPMEVAGGRREFRVEESDEPEEGGEEEAGEDEGGDEGYAEEEEENKDHWAEQEAMGDAHEHAEEHDDCENVNEHEHAHEMELGQ